MDVFDAVASRYSCRAFLPTPVPETTVRDIVERAARAPSAGNMQPWRIYALAGERVEALKALLAPRMANELPKGEGADYTIYPATAERALSRAPLRRSARCSTSRSAFRARTSRRATGNTPATTCSSARRSALFFALDKRIGPAQWADIGGYLQTVMLLARGHGLHTCPQQAWVSLHQTVRAFLESSRQPDDLFRHGARLCRRGRADQSLALPARAARRFCDIFDGFERLIYGSFAVPFSPRSPARVYKSRPCRFPDCSIARSDFSACLALPASVAEPPTRRTAACLTKAEQRAAVAAHKAIPLAEAIKIAARPWPARRSGPRAALPAAAISSSMC